jgi:hypothetical protein
MRNFLRLDRQKWIPQNPLNIISTAKLTTSVRLARQRHVPPHKLSSFEIKHLNRIFSGIKASARRFYLWFRLKVIGNAEPVSREKSVNQA